MKAVAIGLAACVALWADDKPELGKVVSDIAITDLEGKEFKLSDSRADKEKKKEGEITVVYFWSFKCPSGAPVIPEVAKFVENCCGEKSGVKLICVASYGESKDEVAKYLKDNGIKYLVVHDDGRKIAKHFGASQVNTTFVMDKEGKLCYRGGFNTRKGCVAEDAVKAIKDGKEPPASDKKFAG
jgi:thiol-disulfide isomerase/thioredoxin